MPILVMQRLDPNWSHKLRSFKVAFMTCIGETSALNCILPLRTTI